MNNNIRQVTPDDAERCGAICYAAFKSIADEHNFPPDFPAPEIAISLLTDLIANPDFHGVVAESDGKIVGSNSIDERSTIAGIGPMTVDPTVQNRGIGRALMEYAMKRVAQRRSLGVRLIQAAYHNRSLSLYTKLGFIVREPLATIQGAPPALKVPGHVVRAATEADVKSCDRVCLKVHGHDRSGELRDAIKQGSATVVERDGHITGYATLIGFFGHAVGETNEDLKALIGSATEFPGPGFLFPTRNSEIFRWCLQHGLRVVQPMTLMSVGLYNEPAGAFLPSILY